MGSRTLLALVGYIRKRLRAAFIDKHPNQRKEKKMRYKLNNGFFVGFKLIPCYWLYLNKAYGYTLEAYVTEMKEKGKRHQQNAYRRAKGEEYFTPHRLQKMQDAWNASS